MLAGRSEEAHRLMERALATDPRDVGADNAIKVFMGDTGSMALGGALAALAVVDKQELLLAIIGGIFVVEALSVMLQVSYFKYTKRRFGEGRRILKMAPLHHHFEKSGWKETQVVVRFWIIQGLFVAAGVGLFYAEWVRQ